MLKSGLIFARKIEKPSRILYKKNHCTRGFSLFGPPKKRDKIAWIKESIRGKIDPRRLFPQLDCPNHYPTYMDLTNFKQVHRKQAFSA